MHIFQFVLGTITGIINIWKQLENGSLIISGPWLLSTCVSVNAWVSGSKSPRLPSGDPWLALDFGPLICVFRCNRLSDVMALCEISRVILPVLLGDLAWSRPITFPQLSLPSSHAPWCSSSRSSWHLIMLRDPCPLCLACSWTKGRLPLPSRHHLSLWSHQRGAGAKSLPGGDCERNRCFRLPDRPGKEECLPLIMWVRKSDF